MATTGAYRQALQQLFSIQIEDDFSSTDNNINSMQTGFEPIDELQNQSKAQQNGNTNNVVNITDIQNNQNVNDNEITDNYIENEFSSFFN